MQITDSFIITSDHCHLFYRRYEPRPSAFHFIKPTVRGTVILGHGFLRDQLNLSGLANYLARANIRVITVNDCISLFDRNAATKRAVQWQQLATALQLTPVIYMGFSSGGLTALLAAQLDSNSIGAITLDLVNKNSASDYLNTTTFSKPIIGLQGAATNCNANGNGMAILMNASQAWVRTFADAGHCAFESPTDWLCELICQRPANASNDDQQDRARAQIMVATRSAVIALLNRQPQHWITSIKTNQSTAAINLHLPASPPGTTPTLQ
ncbi:alpha/beta hydrolase [Thiospirillum jenense]|uniref:Alpha/beta hydrolase n=1 Tax=Thiospirillum jenense TaxID=1653858 RepID=A0A839HCI9_9GAMM|nr:hypothetical protein [Thiospirillum jenense]MBB1125860.1 hypothetical protein [Thiospirillum jenense]